MLDIVSECLSLTTTYMALHSLREEYKINFDEEMDSTLNLLRYN
jgi:hypothetical protein